MNRGILWLFILLILIGSVNAAPTINLLFPNNPSHSSTTDRIDFKCGASDSDPTIYELSLYTDISGTWQKTGNSCTYGGVNNVNCTFVVLDVPEGTYKYNCKVNNMFWGSSNFTFTFTLVNDKPEFSGTLANKNWTKNTVLNNVWDLKNYFSDPNGDPITYAAHGNNKIYIEITNGIVKLTPLTDWTGSEIVNFSATDDKNARAYSNNVILTVTESGGSPPPTLTCSGAVITWYKDNNKDINLHDYCDPDATSYSVVEYPTNIGVSLSSNSVTFAPNSSWTGTQTVKFNAVKDSLNSNFTFTLTVQEQSSSDEEDEEEEESTTTNEEETVYSITSHSPEADKVSMGVGSTKTFKVETTGDATVNWYVNKEEIGSGESYTFKPDKEGEYELIALIGEDLKTNDDFYSWIVTVGAGNILSENICGNNKADSGENCENCARDVKCAEGEECVNKECVKSTGFFSRVSGFAVDTKDFVVEKWKYSSIIGGAIVILIIIGLVYAGKRRKKDVLYGFGKESFFSKIGKIFKKKGYITKKVDIKPVVEKQAEFYIDKKTFDDNNKL